jgi:hypothetical protein
VAFEKWVLVVCSFPQRLPVSANAEHWPALGMVCYHHSSLIPSPVYHNISTCMVLLTIAGILTLP